jgi:hypothetical protein
MQFWKLSQDASRWALLREAMDAPDLTSNLGPEARRALDWLRGRYHGATADALKELNDPNLPYRLMRPWPLGFSVDPHEVGDVIQAAKEEFGLVY